MANRSNQGVNRDDVNLGGEISSTVLVDGNNSYFSYVTQYASLTIDPSAQSYYFVDEGGVTAVSNGVVSSHTGRPSIRSGSITTGTPGATFLYTGPAIPANTDPSTPNAGFINNLAVDQVNKRIYFTQAYYTGHTDPANGYGLGTPNKALSGLFYIPEAGGAAVQVSAANGLSSPNVVALDLADNIAFVTDVTGAGLTGGQATAVNNLDAINLTTGAVQVLFSEAYHPDSTFGSDYYGGNVLDGLAVDPVTHTLYYTTNNPFNYLSSDAYGDTQNGIYKVGFSVSAGHVTLGATTTLYAGVNTFDPSRIEIDTASGVFYVVGDTVQADPGLQSPGPYQSAIYEGSLSASNQTTLTRVTPATETQGTNNGAAPDPHGENFGYESQGATPIDEPGIGFDAVPTVVAGSTTNYVVGNGATVADAGLTTGSATAANYLNAVVTISGSKPGDVLAATTTGTSITASFTGTILTLSGADTTAHYQQVLDSVTFKNTTADPTGAGGSVSRTLTYSAFDGINTGVATSTVTILTPPVATAGAPSVTFTGGGGAVAVDTVLTVLDYTSTTLAGATISVSSGFLSGDGLSFTNQNGITGFYNGATGALALSGSATVAQYQAAIRAITFSFLPGNGNPTAGNDTSRTLSYTLTDGTLTSTAVTSTLAVVHAPPTMSAGGTIAVTFTRGSGSPVVTDAAATVGAPDSGGTIASASVSVTTGFITGDVLAATGANGIGVAYNATSGVLSLSGTATVAQYQTLLDSVTFSTANAAATGTRTLSYAVNDGTAASTAVTSTVTVVAPTPSLGGAAANQPVADNATLSPFSTMTVTDTAGEGETASLTVKAGATASDANGTLSGASLTKTGTGTYTLSASSPAALQSLLQGLVFTPTANQVAPGSTVTTGFTLSVVDAGGSTATSTTTTVVATSINDAPTIAGTAAGQVTTDLLPVQPFSSVTIGDVDFGAAPTVTITLKSGGAATDAGGTLSGTGLTHTGTGIYTLAAANPATLTSEIRALSFTPMPDQVPIGQVVTTEFDIVATDQSTSATDTTTTVQATDVPCYGRGTVIGTDRGDVAVEDLRPGDRATLADGGTAAVIWVGHRRVDCTRHPRPTEAWPVRVLRGAFGAGVPHCDVLLSPEHAVCVDRTLIPIWCLVNGVTIRQDRVATIQYFHVELEHHAVILAAGLPAESYLDSGNRGSFANNPGPVALVPVFQPGPAFQPGPVFQPGPGADGCLPRASCGPVVHAARTRLLARSFQLGHVACDAPDVHVRAAGRRFDASGAADYVLPADLPEIRIVSRSGVPAEHDADSCDRRRLGVLLRGIAISSAQERRVVPLDHPALGAGFSAVEWHDGRLIRWTHGDAVLPAALWAGMGGMISVGLDIIQVQRSWAAESDPSAMAMV